MANRPTFLKKGKGLQKIPAEGLRDLIRAGERFKKVTGKKPNTQNLKNELKRRGLRIKLK